MSDDAKRDALKLFEELQATFSHLRMRIDPSDVHVDVSVEVPRQLGLSLDVHLSFQNHDELHLCVGAFWYSWFPSTDARVASMYRDAVVGVIAGRNRIVEYERWARSVGADLQAPKERGWETIAKSRCGLLPISWWTTARVVRDEAAQVTFPS